MAMGIHSHQPTMDVLQRPVGLVANGVEDIEMRDIGGQPYGQGAARFGLLSPGNRLSHKQPYQHHEHEWTAISLPLHWCPSCMKASVTMGVKKPVVHSAPPLGRGFGADQELRSPQEVSSHLEPGQRDRAGDVSTRSLSEN